MKFHGVMVYVIRDGKILFLIRNKKNDTVHKQGFYVSLGGKIEPGESIEDAAKREAQEEAGITIRELQPKGVLYFKNFGPHKDDWVDFLFFAEEFTGEPKDGNEGAFVWVDIDKIHTLPMYEGDKVYLHEALKNNFIVMEFTYDQHTYITSKILKKY